MIKIYSWNVNGIRAVKNKGLWEPFIRSHDPDILCLQEIKAKAEQIDIFLGDYIPAFNPAHRPGYSGTAILSKENPLQILNQMPGFAYEDKYGDVSTEGRITVAEYEHFWVISVYNPNAKNDLSRINLRHKHWDPACLRLCQELEKTKPVIFCGDLNVAYTDLDLANPKSNKGKKGVTSEEREGFKAFLDAGFIDTLRLFHTDNGYYTWWSHFANSRARNVGWRIDYILVSSQLKDKVVNAQIHDQVFGSDHCPISISIDY